MQGIQNVSLKTTGVQVTQRKDTCTCDKSMAPVSQVVNAEVNSGSSTRTKLHSTTKDSWMSCGNEV